MIAIEMEMPKGCDECRFQNFIHPQIAICSACVAYDDYNVAGEGKPEWCPLIDIYALTSEEKAGIVLEGTKRIFKRLDKFVDDMK